MLACYDLPTVLRNMEDDMEHSDLCSPTNRHKMCIQCRRAVDRKKYADKKARGFTLSPRAKVEKQRTTAVKRLELREIIYKHYEENPCVECGETRIPCLQLDHVRDKKMKVSSMVSSAVSVKTLLEEISKCRVLCANCHAVHTAKQLGWYAWRAT